MSRPEVLSVSERARGAADYILSAGKEGKERVRVVHTRFNTMACMTCLTADACVHADVARAHAGHQITQGAA